MASNSSRVLVVDDDHDLRIILRTVLERAGHTVLTASDGREALRVVFGERPDAVLLDLAMPELDGWATLERIRELCDVPVLILSGQSSELEKVRALRAGADDFVVKPCGLQELTARVDVLVRRRGGEPTRVAAAVMDDGYLRVDIAACSASVDGVPVDLTPLEFKLLAAFARHPRQVLSREQLLDIVWGDPIHTSLDQPKLYVGYLRRKLAAASDLPLIATVRGFGYRYEPPVALATAA